MSAERSQRPILLLLDWDSTLTERSTLPLIASIATYPNQHPQFAGLSKAYNHDLNVHDSAYNPNAVLREALDQEIKYLDSLGPVETASIFRITDSGIFNGVRLSDIERVATTCAQDGTVRLRKGWERLIDHVWDSGCDTARGEVHIISVAWSATFIHFCLKFALEQLAYSHCVRDYYITVHTNDIDLRTGSLAGSASLDGSYILTATDKLNVMRHIVSEYQTAHSQSEPATVYMGDSSTDLACLIEADVGICIWDRDIEGEQKQLKETVDRLRVDVNPISKCSTDKQRDKKTYQSDYPKQKALWSARDFQEVLQSGILQ